MKTTLLLALTQFLAPSPQKASEIYPPRAQQMSSLLAESKKAAQPEEGGLRQMLLNGIFQRSPLGRFDRKDFSPGVKDFRSDKRCHLEDLTTLFMLQQPPMKLNVPDLNAVVSDAAASPKTKDMFISIRFFESQLLTELSKQLSFFNRHPKSTVREREICIVSADLGAPNAFSIGFGFMVFDPQLFFQIARAEKANSWSMRTVLAHELAHQLQVWHQSPTAVKTRKDPQTGALVPYVRDQELEADCTASVILAYQRELQGVVNPAEDHLDVFRSALYDAAVSLGDFEFGTPAQHHGTAYERALMINAGLKIYEELKAKQDLRSESVLSACLATINELNRIHGESLWPIGSPLP